MDHWTYGRLQTLWDTLEGLPLSSVRDSMIGGAQPLRRGEFGVVVRRVLEAITPGDGASPAAVLQRAEWGQHAAAALARLLKEFRPEVEAVCTAEATEHLGGLLARFPAGHWFHEQAQQLLAEWGLLREPAPPAVPMEGGQPAASAGFPDVPPDHWAAAAVERLREAGIISGYPFGTFGGNDDA